MQRRSSCLFQKVSVETCSFLPNDQGDRGNLPRQGETSHRWSHPFGEQVLVKIAERSSAGARPHGRTLEDILEIVVMVRIPPTKLRWFLGTLQLSLDGAVLRAVVGLQRKPAVGPPWALGAEAVGRLPPPREPPEANQYQESGVATSLRGASSLRPAALSGLVGAKNAGRRVVGNFRASMRSLLLPCFSKASFGDYTLRAR